MTTCISPFKSIYVILQKADIPPDVDTPSNLCVFVCVYVLVHEYDVHFHSRKYRRTSVVNIGMHMHKYVEEHGHTCRCEIARN